MSSVVKFLNNSQHARVLVNDWLGIRLAGMIGLSVPVVAIVHVRSVSQSTARR